MLLSPHAIRRLKTDSGAGYSLRRRLTLYWACMALAVLSAALLLFSVTGVTSRTARQFHTALETQRSNTAAQLTAQMDTLTAKGIAFSKQIGTELDSFLAQRGLAFEALNDNPELMEELESALLPMLKTTLEGTPCSGAYLSLDATANTALPEAEHSRMGLYLRYSGLYSANPSQNMMYFRGTVAAAREAGLSLHNRWNVELDTALIDGWAQVMGWTGDRLSDGCLWTERLSLTDTWEDVTLLCVPIRDEAGTVRGVCGIELSALYFSKSHGAVSSPYGSFFTLLAPMNGDRLLLDRAMAGETAGARLPSDGELRVKGGKYYDTVLDAVRLFTSPQTDMIFYTAEDVSTGGAMLCAAAGDITTRMKKILWQPDQAFVLTSGTMAVGSDFRRFKTQAGLEKGHRVMESVSPSPFDYRNNCLLYLPQIPPRQRAENTDVYFDELTAELVGLIKAVTGHALVLFTSYAAMSAVKERLREASLPFPLLTLGRNAPHIIEQFRHTPGAVLLATGAAWEGFDFPGDCVSLLVIPRLPFAYPDARKERELEKYSSLHAFIREVAVPEMQIKLRQGFGRAIRTESDTCVIAILDERACRGRRYAQAVSEALPEMRRTGSLREVNRFLREKKPESYFEVGR